MQRIKIYMCNDTLPTKEEIIEAVEISKSDNCKVIVINRDYKKIFATTDMSNIDEVDRFMEIMGDYHAGTI